MDALHRDSFDHRAITTDSLLHTLLVLGVQVISFVKKKDEDNRQGRQTGPTDTSTECTANLTCTDRSTCNLIENEMCFDEYDENEYDENENGIDSTFYTVPCIFPFVFKGIRYDKCLYLRDYQDEFPGFTCPIRKSSTQTDGINSFTKEDLTNWDPINPIPSDPNNPCTILPLFSQCNDTCSWIGVTVDLPFCQENPDLCEAFGNFVLALSRSIGIALISVSAVTGISLLSSGGSAGGLFGGAGGLFGGAGGLFGGVGGLFGVNCPPTQCVVQGRCCPLQADSSGRNICPSNC